MSTDTNNNVSEWLVATYINKLSAKEQTSGIIGIVIAILQMLIGILGYIPALIVGIINLIGAISCLKQSKKVLTPYRGMIEEYEKQLTGYIIAIIYNTLFGGVIGVISNVIGLQTRNYVLENRYIFASAVAQKEGEDFAEAEPLAEGMGKLIISYEWIMGGSRSIHYRIDYGSQKYLIKDGQWHTYDVMEGVHIVTFKYLFKERNFRIEVNGNTKAHFVCDASKISMYMRQ